MAKFSVGLVVYKTDVAELKKLFDLLSQETSLSQMFVFDNAEDQALKAEVQARGWSYLSCGENIGFGAAHNRILANLSAEHGEFHWIVNPDLEWNASPTRGLIEHLQQTPLCGAVMPDVRSGDGSRQYLAKELPTPLILIGRRFFSRLAHINARIDRYEMRSQSYTAAFESSLISGCCFFTRQSLLKKVHGFDERYFLYLEDYDLCRKIWQVGFMLMVVPEVQVQHGHGRASYQIGKAFVLHLKSACQYFCKWGWFSDVEGRHRV